MKNVYLYIMFLLVGFNSLGQGVDVIFWIDNSGSITNEEYNEIKTSVQNVIHNILECNGSRVAVVNYWADDYSLSTDRIYIESNFTTNEIIANTFQRRSAAQDIAHESLELIGKALDGISDVGIVSPQKNLTHLANNSLVIVLFTDAHRSQSGSSLVRLVSGNNCSNCNLAFTNYTSFKVDRDAAFMVVWTSSDTNSDYVVTRNAAAAIASGGGSYTGPYETYPADPDAGTYGRYFLQPDDFTLTASEINLISNDICSVEEKKCKNNLVITSPVYDVNGGDQFNRQAQNTITASNIINSGATGIYHAGDDIVLKHGFYSDGGSKFRAYIEGCSGEFVGLTAPTEEAMMASYATEDAQEETQLFTLSPNPATETTTIASKKVMTDITVTSLDGYAFFKKQINGNSYELYIGNYPKGFYVVTVTTDTGEMEMQKLIKN